jgi:transcriptional regulator with XRE-family HTH domain
MVATERSEVDLGIRLRAERLRAGISLRELARRLGLTPSAISQFETGKSRPSVGTLFEIVEQLGVSLDDMLKPASAARAAKPPPEVQAQDPGLISTSDSVVAVERQVEHALVNLDKGVQWQPLGRMLADVEFLLITYKPGSSSSINGKLTRHKGREFGYVISGELDVDIGSEVYKVGEGDSITFPASVPHRLRNTGFVPAKVMWCMFALDK